MDFGVILEVENAFKIDQKSIQKVIQHKMPDKRDFWSILGGSWRDFGVILGSKCAQEGSKRGLRGSKMGPRGSKKKIQTHVFKGFATRAFQEGVKGGS